MTPPREPDEATPPSMRVLLLGAAVATPWLLWPAQGAWLWLMVCLDLCATLLLRWARSVWPHLMSKLMASPLPVGSRLSFWACVVQMIVVGPFVEELLFRLVPKAVLGLSWWVGACAAVLFAFLHNLPGNPLRSLPLSQLVSGLFLWGALRTAGIGAAIWMHASENLCLGLLFLPVLRLARRRAASARAAGPPSAQGPHGDAAAGRSSPVPPGQDLPPGSGGGTVAEPRRCPSRPFDCCVEQARNRARCELEQIQARAIGGARVTLFDLHRGTSGGCNCPCHGDAPAPITNPPASPRCGLRRSAHGHRICARDRGHDGRHRYEDEDNS